ncbi:MULTISPECIES: glycosyltransferase [Bacteroidales]|uniref:Glycosyltransferase 2-like domain-containing protein n=1 Tax=Coprobacter secundus subsp. similis TaxID=2751153 RepID=A0A7G1HXV6_9BACT|nr:MULTISPECIES: glycosyltransferase [Bacteroidales]BCI63863.1 hypothetical protein Cop2CBH44_22160 [Coprobacter secundus subsp. similis]CCY38848.1 glycosyltransferases involved in cell wall biogenesis [Tannerella sp. CAG:118]
MLHSIDLSVIIPVYNVEKYLPHCLESVLIQADNNIEVIAINDGSIDKSPEILDQYATQYPSLKIINQPNQGVSAARQKGITVAHGKYILFLDADDFLEASSLSILYKKAIEADADMVLMDYYTYNPDDQKKTYIQQISIHQYSQASLLKQMFCAERAWAVWSYIAKKELHETIKYNLVSDLSIGEDAVYTTQIVLAAHKITSINKPLINYVSRPDSVTQQKNISDRQFSSYLKFPQRIYDLLYPSYLYPELKESIAYVFLRACYETFYFHHFKNAATIARLAYRQQQVIKSKKLLNNFGKWFYKAIRYYHIHPFLGNLYIKKCLKRGKI